MPRIFSEVVHPTAPAPKPEAPSVLPKLAHILGRIIDTCLHLTVFLVPILFSTLTVDVLELNKQTILVFLASVAVVAWLGKALAEKHFSLSRSWLHLTVVLFGLGYLAVSLFSQDRYLSIVGGLSQTAWSFTTLASLILIYIVAVNRIRTLTQVYDFLLTFLASSLVTAVYGLAQMFGWHLIKGDVTGSRGFTSVGTVFSLAMYAVAPIVIASGLAFHGCRDRYCLIGSDRLIGKIGKLIVWMSMVANFSILALVDYWPAWVSLLFGLALTVGISLVRSRKIGRPTALVLPGLLVALAVLLLCFKTPFPVSVPAEVVISGSASWDVARQSLQAHPLFGSGPGTWAYDYSQFRSPVVNASPFWAMRFDRGFSSFFTLLATVGLVGVALWLLLIGSAVAKSATHLLRERNEDVWLAYLTIFSGWATVTLTAFFYSYGMAHQAAFWILLALLGSMVAREAFVWDARKNASAYSVISLLFALGAVAGISVIWLAGQRLMADVRFSKGTALFRADQPFSQVISQIESAHRLNPWNDTYARNLSQAHLVNVANMVQSRPQDAQNQQVVDEINAAINYGKEATRLSSANIDNWANLALVYQSVASFMPGADEFAIKNYVEASAREPQNPIFLDELGKLYLLRSDAFRTLLNTKGSTAKSNAEAQKNIQDNLKQADEYLRRSILVKPDYLPAHYHLGMVFERQNKLSEAIGQLEEILKRENQNTGVAFELSLLYYRNNEKDRALNLMEQIVKLEEAQTTAARQANARWYLAAMYEERGRLNEAIAQIEKLVQQLPDNAAVQQRLDALKKARDAKQRPAVKTLPEPLMEDVVVPAENNPVKKK